MIDKKAHRSHRYLTADRVSFRMKNLIDVFGVEHIVYVPTF